MSVLSQVTHEGSGSQRIDIVFDVYHDKYIKDLERQRRGEGIGMQLSNIAPGHTIQQWRKLLRCASSKKNLIRFLVNEWQKAPLRENLNDTVLYVTCEEKCYKLTKEASEVETDLECFQEEADTRLLLHALHAAESGIENVVINADDSDVLVIAFGTSSLIPQT